MNCIDQIIADDYTAINGDCVEALKGLPDHSIGYSIFSPPFASLYTYSNSPRDMGNVRSDAEFFEHFDYLIAELARVMMPGRDVSFHCMLLPASKERDGYIGLKDFRGDLIRAFQGKEASEMHGAMLALRRRAVQAVEAGDFNRAERLNLLSNDMAKELQDNPCRHGFIHHSEAVIWKDPVTAMQRTKALGLLHKSVRENAAMCRQGIPDYLVTMRAPGESDRVKHGAEYPVDLWQKVASPVWMDINPSDTLQYRSAREHDDERHICPLQLDVIRRGVMLWSNPGDIVLSPFMGIGSEGFVALEMGRKFVGVELKESYFRQAVANLAAAKSAQSGLFELDAA
jgi:DNA modification methylase